MEPSEERKYSFPNADQHIPGTTGPLRPEADSNFIQPKRVVNIIEALSNSKDDDLIDVRPVRTYQEDITDAIKNDNVSMIKIALAEKKRQGNRESYSTIIDSEVKSGSTYLIAGIILFVLILAGLVFGYFYLNSQSTANQGGSVAQTQISQIIYTEMSSVVDVDGMDSNVIFKSINQEKRGLMDTGTMKAVYLTTGQGTSTRPLNTEEFFRSLKTRAPNSVVWSLDPNFLLGVYAYTPRDMFAIFKVKSYDTAFAGMLDWEPNIETDIGNIFINKDENASSTNITSGLQIFSQKKFVDKVLVNKDTRILQDQDGVQYMLYTFLDKDTLVIATSEKSLKEILFRLTTGRIVR